MLLESIDRQHLLPVIDHEVEAKSSGDRVPSSWWCARGKDVFEFLAAGLMLVVAAPVILLAGLLIKLTSRGPMFYSQTRLGRYGIPYTIYKIRTMTHECESLTGPRWAEKNDPRITPVGHFLRRTHLDELPQLWNILRGDMSLVGPRPERPEFVAGLARVIPRYTERLTVRPGVSGLAQVQLPADTELESVKLKIIYDIYYIHHVSFWLDLRIVACTALHMFGVPFPFLGQLFRLPQREVMEGVYRAPLMSHLDPVLQPQPA
jgi:lipopolysaccharide/colanic/teichoic acid biosynthesis glycosyltransferase